MSEPLQPFYSDIDKAGIRVDPKEILRLLGYEHGETDSHTSYLVDQYINECMGSSSPRGAFVLADAMETKSSHELSVPGVTFHSGRIIHQMLRNSEKYALFLVSAGPEPEKLVRNLMEKGNYLEGYIADLAASAIVDLAADQIEEQVRQLANKLGLFITNRYSPGYCSWNVEEQQKLFSLFPEGCCGIRLSESSLMNPVKSISGIIGIGAGVEYSDYTCELCSMKNCHFRKVRIN
jgi:hypothetical protein